MSWAELCTQWNLDDILQAHEVLDAFERAETEAEERRRRDRARRR